MQKALDVLVVGNAILDTVGRCDEQALAKLHAPKGHMTLVSDPLEIEAMRQELKHYTELAGGSGANTATGVASLGGRAGFIGKTAGDECGHIFRSDIQRAGVEFDSAPTLLQGKKTARSLILVTPDAARTMLTFLGCSQDLDAGAIDAEKISSAAVVLLEGYLFDAPGSRAALVRAAAVAKANKRTIALTLPDTLCIERHRFDFIELIRSATDLVIANEAEVKCLYRTSSFSEAVAHIRRDCRLAAITRGSQGSLLVSTSSDVTVPAEKVRTLVDRTGAGDLYAAGLLYGMSRGLKLEASGRLAGFAAAEILSILGARPQVRLSHLAQMRGFLV